LIVTIVAAPRIPFSVAVAAIAAVGIALYVWKKGGLANVAKGAGAAVAKAAKDAGAAVANAAGEAVSGGVGAVSKAVGLPTPDDTTTDPRVARWLIDQVGYWEASKWAGLPALVEGARMAPGSGQAPPPNSAVGKAFPNQASYDETNRLLNRYPAPDRGMDASWSDPASWGLPI
jgi:hypothetical protein